MTKILKMNGPEFHLIVIGIIISILAGGSQPLFSIILSEFLKVKKKFIFIEFNFLEVFDVSDDKKIESS